MDDAAWNECMKIAASAEVVFIKRPLYESKKIFIQISKNFVKSEVLFDSTNSFLSWNKRAVLQDKKSLFDFPEELDMHSFYAERPKREVETTKTKPMGYCIRTGAQIPYNPNSPLSYDSWKVWSQYNDMDFPEAYCHKTGAKSYGKTSMRRPIL